MVSPLYGFPARPLDATLQRQIRAFQDAPDVTSVLNALPHVVLILNERRQVVFANRHLTEMLGLESLEPVYGRAPGELLDCPHAFDLDNGSCGTTDVCEGCGANRVISFCRRGEQSVQECRLTQRSTGRAIDVRVAGTPIRINGESFTMLVLTDISSEKRRQALERVFFHDLLNVATGIVAYSAVLRRSPQGELAAEAAESISMLVHRLADEINAQRCLNDAENGEMQPRIEPVRSGRLIDAVVQSFREHPVAENRQLVVHPESADVEFMSDDVLLMRVLGNMVKNALEAIEPGQKVVIGCKAVDHTVEFSVHNPGEMPRDVQLQVFQRSFSTKGRGRGLGTYSIKLLTERYLKGRAWFTSTAEDGTTFHVSIPREP